MKKTIGVELIVYGLLLGGLGYLAYHLAPALARATFMAAAVGGGLSLIWGLRTLAGNRGKALPGLTLAAVTFVMITQTVMGWGGGSHEGAGHRAAFAIIALLLLLSVAMMMRIAWAGLVLDAPPPNATNDAGTKRPSPGRPADPGMAGRARRV